MIFRLLFVTIVRQHVEYGITVWNSFQNHLIKNIENLQRRTSKEIPGICRNIHRQYPGDMIELYKLFHHCYNESSSQTTMKSMNKHSLKNQVEITSSRYIKFCVKKQHGNHPSRTSETISTGMLWMPLL